MTISRRRSVVAGAAATTVLVLSSCGTSRAPEATGSATAQGVAVAVTLLPLSGGQHSLQVTFSPRQAGFHIYSIDLPAHGVDGLGIPTRLSVRGDLTAVGMPTANQTTRLLRPAGLPTEIPVYPDGPVTFTVPVRQTGAHQADVLVSYGACSETTCLMPVNDEVINLSLH
jgi:hypothetical protein